MAQGGDLLHNLTGICYPVGRVFVQKFPKKWPTDIFLPIHKERLCEMKSSERFLIFLDEGN